MERRYACSLYVGAKLHVGQDTALFNESARGANTANCCTLALPRGMLSLILTEQKL